MHGKNKNPHPLIKIWKPINILLEWPYAILLEVKVNAAAWYETTYQWKKGGCPLSDSKRLIGANRPIFCALRMQA